MVDEIRLYVEGGGDPQTKALVRKGFGCFFKDLVEMARRKRIKWQIIACGPRSCAFDAFQRALKTHFTAFNVLLIDSEGPVPEHQAAWSCLHEQAPSWTTPPGVKKDQCYRMVQAMEAWLVADGEALGAYYGKGFRGDKLPTHSNVEQIDRERLIEGLKSATRQTSKGDYKKKHGLELLSQIDPARVRPKAARCERLFTTLEAVLTKT